MLVLDALRSGFTFPTAEWHLQVVRILLGASVLWKALTSAFLGDWNRFRGDSFDVFLLSSRIPTPLVALIRRVHKPSIAFRAMAGVAIGVGWHTRIAIVVAVASLIVEVVYEYRFHNLFISLSLLALLPAGSLGSGAQISHAISDRNTFSATLLIILTCDLYLNGAWIKWRSAQFRSGASLQQMLYVSRVLRPLLKHPEYWHPRWLESYFAHSPGLAKMMATGVLVIECLLPVLLLLPATYWIAVATGVGLHLSFSAILPVRLVPFGASVVGSYLAFKS